MNFSKIIDISKSSLIGLKAELLKKQEEVRKIKESQNDYVKPPSKQKRASKVQKQNKGVEERSLKDSEHTEEDLDILKKSRELLEAKAKLYDKLKLNEGDGEANTKYLIDFDLKQEIYSSNINKDDVEESISQLSEDPYSDSNSDPENDWVDFVDTLGRSRRCLKKDLSEMRAKDAHLAASLRPPSPPPAPEVAPELLSWDMQREIMRKKWEEQETQLLGKTDIHYQDVLFDEARPHGVGYFGFSTDESLRQRQQQELKNMRKETIEQQQAAVGLRVRRQQQLEARLAAARRRKRERLGLPPEDPEVPKNEVAEVVDNNPEQEEHSEKIKDMEESIKKMAPIRPWDIGKQENNSVMSQEEWVDMKRSERPQEFAPPMCLLEQVKDETPNFKNKNRHMKMNFTNAKSDSTGRSLPHRKVCSTKTSHLNRGNDLSQNNIEIDKKTRNCNLSFEVPESNNELSFSNLQNSACCDSSFDQFNYERKNKSDSKNSVTSSNVFCPINIRKPSSEDIDDLQTIYKEKSYNHKETEVISIGHYAKSQGVNQNKDAFSSQLNSPKYKKNINLLTGDNEPMKEMFEKSNQNVMDSERSLMINQNNSKSKIIEEDVGIPTSDETMVTNKTKASKRKWAEIPPPTSMSYYVEGVASSKQHTSSKTNLSESISVGLNFLKSKEKKESRLKGLLDVL